MKTIVILLALSLAPACSASAAEQQLLPVEEITIAAVGDLMLGGRAEPFLEQFGPDYPYRNVLPAL